jgi:hypothetical protein
MIAAIVLMSALQREYVMVLPKGEIGLMAPIERIAEVVGQPDAGRLAETVDFAAWERSPGRITMELGLGMVDYMKIERSDYNAAAFRLPDWSDPENIKSWLADPNKLTFTDIFAKYDRPYKIGRFEGEGEMYYVALYAMGPEGSITMGAVYQEWHSENSLPFDASDDRVIEYTRGKPVHALELFLEDGRYPDEPPALR